MRVARLAMFVSLISAAVCSVASHAVAQVTSACVRGAVKGADDGVPMAGVEVTIVEESTGAEKTATTNEQGEFAFNALQVGGPYHVTANLMGFKPSEEKGIFLTANRTRDVALGMRLQEEVIEVSGTAVARNTSNKTVVAAAEIDSLPSVGRDPRDVVRRNPEASVEGSSKTLTIGGNNNRFNSITVDGTRQDDDFGLNSSGYPTRRSPIALSAIQELTVDSSPFDVHFGKFLGGNVNIVTKSGTNDFKGTLVGTYSSNDLRGSRSRDNHVRGDFNEYRYGVTFSGPLAKDEMHFLLSFEGLTSTSPISNGPLDSGAAITTTGVTKDEMQRAIDIARDVYGFNAGTPAGSLDEADRKFLGKLDWNIDKQNRASLIYQRTSGNSISLGNGATATTLPLSSNWYNARDALNTFSTRVFSDWSDRLSTQIEANAKVVSSRVPPVNGNGFMQASVRTPGGTIILGPDRFRHSNLLDNDVYHTRGEANYLAGGHLITGGIEYEQLRIKNLFVSDSNGNVVYNTLDDFMNMKPASIQYQNSVTLNPRDASANWNLGTWTGYVQDQFKLTSERTEIYQTSNKSSLNPNFVEKYGFSNTETLSGRSVIMPRLGVSWLPLNNLNVRVGAGLYSGGTPGVWVSNNYTNDGVRTFSLTSRDPLVTTGFNGRDIPAQLKTAVQNGAGNGNVDALDPDFKIPSVWKIGSGADYALSLGPVQNIELRANYTFSKVNHGIIWKDLRRDLDVLPNNTPLRNPDGTVMTTPDGRPLYSPNFNATRGFDMLLSNSDRGYGHVLSGVVQKGFDFGLFLAATYAYTINKEVTPGTSSISTSNYRLAAVIDPQNPDTATSNYERRHRFTEAIEFTHPILSHVTDSSMWSKLKTSIGMFIESRSGQPYSWTFRGNDQGLPANGTRLGQIFGEEATFAASARSLAYIPTEAEVCAKPAAGQPIPGGCKVELENVEVDELNAFINYNGLAKYRGRIAPRNAFQSPWYTRIDMRVAQDLPNPLSGNRARFVVDIENVGNLLNRKWGRLQQVNFPYATPIPYDLAYDRMNNAYIFQKPAASRPINPTNVDITQSVWRLSLGLLYDF